MHQERRNLQLFSVPAWHQGRRPLLQEQGQVLRLSWGRARMRAPRARLVSLVLIKEDFLFFEAYLLWTKINLVRPSSSFHYRTILRASRRAHGRWRMCAEEADDTPRALRAEEADDTASGPPWSWQKLGPRQRCRQPVRSRGPSAELSAAPSLLSRPDPRVGRVQLLRTCARTIKPFLMSLTLQA